MRWQDLASRRIVLDELSQAMGGLDMTHPELQRGLEAARTKVLQLYEALVEVSGPFELGGADEECAATARVWVRRDDIREAPPNTAQREPKRTWAGCYR
ncbi:MAG: hypothetical protein ABIP13_01255 [Tepidiformaceae bacterium]